MRQKVTGSLIVQICGTSSLSGVYLSKGPRDNSFSYLQPRLRLLQNNSFRYSNISVGTNCERTSMPIILLLTGCPEKKIWNSRLWSTNTKWTERMNLLCRCTADNWSPSLTKCHFLWSPVPYFGNNLVKLVFGQLSWHVYESSYRWISCQNLRMDMIFRRPLVNQYGD